MERITSLCKKNKIVLTSFLLISAGMCIDHFFINKKENNNIQKQDYKEDKKLYKERQDNSNEANLLKVKSSFIEINTYNIA